MLWTKFLKRLSEDDNENLLHQNELLKAQVLELQAHQNGRVRYSIFFKRRLARLAKLLTPEGLSEACLVVKPRTVLRWHRELIAKKFDGSKSAATLVGLESMPRSKHALSIWPRTTVGEH